MQAHAHDHTDAAGAGHGSLKTYLSGFVLSIILTVVPFGMVMHNPGVSRATVLAVILALALIQILVHLVCFLHMSTRSDQRWNVLSFAFTVLVLALLVGGSVWIMANMMTTLAPASAVMPVP